MGGGDHSPTIVDFNGCPSITCMFYVGSSYIEALLYHEFIWPDQLLWTLTKYFVNVFIYSSIVSVFNTISIDFRH